jgi:hypothetical protein
MAENELEADRDRKERVAFHMEEFKALKAEMLEDTKVFNSNYLYAVASSGGIVAWLLGSSGPKCGPWTRAETFSICCLPLFVSALLFLQSLGARNRTTQKGLYLSELEKLFSLPNLGWQEGWSKKDRRNVIGKFLFGRITRVWFPPESNRTPVIGLAEALSWGLLLIAGVLVALIGFIYSLFCSCT